MKILKKITSVMCCNTSVSSCSSNSESSDYKCKTEKCNYTQWTLCVIKKFLFVALCFAVIAPCVGYFIAPKVIHRYLINNPEAIIESVQKFSERKQQEMQEASSGKVDEVYQSSVKDSKLPFVGNKNGSHVIVVFYDYSCGYCKKAANELKTLMSKDSQLKIVLKDLPLFGANSIAAAKSSMFVYEKHPEKFENFYTKLMATKDIDEKSINAVAKSLGINGNIVSESKSLYESEIRNTYVQAGEVRIDGTPAMLINGKLHLGLKSADDIAKLF